MECFYFLSDLKEEQVTLVWSCITWYRSPVFHLFFTPANLQAMVAKPDMSIFESIFNLLYEFCEPYESMFYRMIIIEFSSCFMHFRFHKVIHVAYSIHWFRKIREFAGYKRSATLDWLNILANVVFRQLPALYFAYTGGLIFLVLRVSIQPKWSVSKH